jgi:hypothetical protein
MKYHIAVWGSAIGIAALIFFGLIAIPPLISSKDYYYEQGAPNGIYNIHVVTVENGTVFATMAVDAGDLHGFWNYDNTIFEVDKFFTYYLNAKEGYVGEDLRVRIENNIIVEVWGT